MVKISTGLPLLIKLFVIAFVIGVNIYACKPDSKGLPINDVTASLPETATLKNPVDGAIDENVYIKFEWNLPTNTSGLRYTLLLDTKPNIGPDKIIAGNLTQTSFIYDKLTTAVTYYWKVVSLSQNVLKTESKVFSFTTVKVIIEGATEPAPLSPLDNAVGTPLQSFLTWSTSNWLDAKNQYRGPLQYDVYLSVDKSNLEKVSNNQPATTYKLPQLVPHFKIFYWQIKSKYNDDIMSSSKIQSFTTAIDTTALPPSKPILKYPNNLEQYIHKSTLFTWTNSVDPSNYPITYHFYIGENTSSLKFAGIGVTKNEYRPNNLDYSKTYFWRVIAYNEKGASNLSDIFSFKTKGVNVAPSKVIATNPPNDAKSTKVDLILQWGKSSDGNPKDNITYSVYMGKSSNNLQLTAKDLSTTELAVHNLYYLTTYYWRVDTSDGQIVTTGDTYKFRTADKNINNNLPTKPTLRTPIDNQTNVDINPLLSWNASFDSDNDPLTYSIYLGKDQNNLGVVVTNYQFTQVSHTRLKYGITYFWQIEVNDSKETNQSDIFSFETAADNNSVNYAPTVVAPKNPANNTQGVAINNTMLEWTASTDKDGDTLIYEVFFGENQNNLNSVGKYQQNTLSHQASNLKSDTNYYWRVDTYDGKVITKGDIFSFRTAINNNLPDKVTIISPADKALNIGNHAILKWNASNDIDNDPLTYNVYFGQNQNNLVQIATNINALEFRKTNLTPSTSYYWRIDVSDGKATVAGTVFPFQTISLANNSPPTKVTAKHPTDKASDIFNNVTLEWTASSDQDNDIIVYNLYFGTNKSNLTQIGTNLQVLEVQQLNLNPLSTYYWRVDVSDSKAVATGDTFSFQTGNVNNIPSKVTVKNPANNTVSIPKNVTLEWNISVDTDNDPLTYNVYLGTNQNNLTQIGANLNTLTLQAPNLTLSTIYYWRVDVSDSKAMVTGDVFSFQTIANTNTPPITPVLTSPNTNQVGVALIPTLTWDPSTDLDGDLVTYDVYLGKDQNNLQKVATTLNTNYSPLTQLDASTDYFWRVDATDRKATTPSVIGKFTTQ